MRKWTGSAAALALLISVLSGVVGLGADAATSVRIMPLGDSITGSPGCWRALLWKDLRAAGHGNIRAVGTLGPTGCAEGADGDNEGHGGYLVTNVAQQNQLPAWLSVTRPDVVLMHFGTNDVMSDVSPGAVIAAYSELVDQMRASNSHMKIVVSQIIPMSIPACQECGQRVRELNWAIPAWVAAKTTRLSPIVLVDQWTGFSPATDTYDGIHPNARGNRKIATNLSPAVVALLRHSAR
jgi:lysophospholipase L1-like esterase